MSVKPGDPIPDWVMPCVSAQRMQTMAAILRDPNPLHWDRDAVNALPLGLGKRTINQGPLGLSYMINMLQAWAGPDCIRRIVMRFPDVVLDGDRVTASGVVDSVYTVDAEQRADCRVWLEHDERGILLEGNATITLQAGQ